MGTLETLTNTRYTEYSIPRFRIFVVIQGAWMILLFSLFQLLGSFSFERFYLLSYIGLVVCSHLFAPVDSIPRWWRSVKWLVRLGFLGLCYFIVVRVDDIVQF